MYQHLPSHRVPSLLAGLIVNQSRSPALLISMYLISACSSCSRFDGVARAAGGRLGEGGLERRQRQEQAAASRQRRRRRRRWVWRGGPHLLEPLLPLLLVAGARLDGQQRDFLHRRLGGAVPRVRHGCRLPDEALGIGAGLLTAAWGRWQGQGERRVGCSALGQCCSAASAGRTLMSTTTQPMHTARPMRRAVQAVSGVQCGLDSGSCFLPTCRDHFLVPRARLTTAAATPRLSRHCPALLPRSASEPAANGLPAAAVAVHSRQPAGKRPVWCARTPSAACAPPPSRLP